MYSLIYIISIVAVNYAFSVLPMIHTPWGAVIPMATFIVGFTFILRDLVQRTVGHWVLVFMLIATVISYFMADPAVVIASVCAFAVSELIDWAVFTIKGGSLRSRILLSSAASAPVDSFIFLALLPFPGTLTLTAVATMTAAKMIAAVLWWFYLRGND